MPNTAPNEAVSPPQLHIAVGVIRDPQGRILISKRRAGTPGAGLWEFPGGKAERGEGIRRALDRELAEELGVEVTQARPLIRIRHDYSDRQVLLDTWLVDAWRGEPQGREGQAIAWVATADLPQWDLLPANQPLTNAALLPDSYLITPDVDAMQASAGSFMRSLEQSLAQGLRIVRLRLPQLADADYAELASSSLRICHAAGAELLLDRDVKMVTDLGASGLHLNSARLMQMTKRPDGLRWLAASCHNPEELARAEELGCDFAVLGPLTPTATHPDGQSLGWDKAAAMIDKANLPVYLIGGLSRQQRAQVWQAGAQGIAAIRSLWAAVSGTGVV